MTPKQAAAFAKKYLYAFPKVVSGLKCPPHIKFLADKIQSKINVVENIKSEKYNLLMVSMPPRHGKPVDEESLILMGDGSLKKLKYIKNGDEVITHKGRPRKVLNVFIQNELDCVNIETSSGRIASAALDHPYLTPEGWVNAGNIKTGMCLTSLTKYSGRDFVEYNNKIYKARLAGYFVGDGSCGNITTTINAKITCCDEAEAKDIRCCIEN